jgi:hypothetical protein
MTRSWQQIARAKFGQRASIFGDGPFASHCVFNDGDETVLLSETKNASEHPGKPCRQTLWNLNSLPARRLWIREIN